MDSAAFFQMVTKGGAVGTVNRNPPPPPPPTATATGAAPGNVFAAHGFEYQFQTASTATAAKLAPVTTHTAHNNPTTLYSPLLMTPQQQAQPQQLAPSSAPTTTNNAVSVPTPVVQQQQAPAPVAPAMQYAAPQQQQQQQQTIQYVYVQQAPPTANAVPQPPTATAAATPYYAFPTGPTYVPPPPPMHHHVILPAAASSVAHNPLNTVPIHPNMHDTCGPVLLNGRLRHGRNVHTALAGVCRYVSYNDPIPTSSIMIQGGGAPNGGAAAPTTPLPLFVQMFPSEHKEQFQLLFERILQLVCGPAIATVHAAEPRSDTSFLVFLTTTCVWHVIHFLRCRVLMDRHGFWYAEDFAQFEALMQYCDRVRSLPPPQRNAATDGLPSRALVVELSRTAATVQSAPPAPAPFDAQLQMRTRE